MWAFYLGFYLGELARCLWFISALKLYEYRVAKMHRVLNYKHLHRLSRSNYLHLAFNILQEAVIKNSFRCTQQKKSLTLTMSGPQVVPSAAGMNLVSHRCPTRWHQSDLQMSCQTSHTQNEWVVYNWQQLAICPLATGQNLKRRRVSVHGTNTGHNTIYATKQE